MSACLSAPSAWCAKGMADDEAPAAEVVAADGGPESNEGAAPIMEVAEQELEGAAEANGVTEAQPAAAEIAAEPGTEQAAEAPRERSSKHASRRENDDARERRRDDDGALAPVNTPPLILTSRALLQT